MTPLTHPGAPAPETPDWHVTAFLGPRPGDDGRPMLDAVRALRAGIRADHGTHTDDQDLDFGAWHFIARRSPGGPPLGYIRLSTPDTDARFRSRGFLGDERYEELLAAEGFGTADVFEHGRLVVEHHARRLGLGLHLNALAIGAAHHLGARAVIGPSGTRDGQDRFHERFGFRPVRGTRRYVPQNTEDVVIMLHRVADGGGRHRELITRLRDEFPFIAAAGTTAPLLPVPPVRRTARVSPAGLVAPDRETWRPVLHTAADLEALLASGKVREVHDTIDDQLTELVRCREPACHDRAAIERGKQAQPAGAQPWEYGTWAWYPWSGRLVHVLPREEFRLVRTTRSLISWPDRRRLFGKRIGVIGLSAGNSAALTFALEGIGGSYRLADSGSFGPADLNRLRGGVHDLGVGKAVLTARQLAEIDPYLDIEIERAGLTPETIERFFAGGLDLLVEECDTPWAKIAAREYARDLGIPVVMGGDPLDVERFDREPDRPLLHGLLGDVKSVDVLDPGLIPAMLDAGRISPELAAWFGEQGSSPSSGPRPALGGALREEAARRILLGRPCESGRFSAGLEQPPN
ncbi:activating enzyme of the ubiquitin-like protein [Amycolatopsis mediterranei S699]|uniref:Activating enzyme of the ubiquitin-like protein n=3 Tax=Amycolatopsis mediterranei TaxID=33910 RepID=A0A0H3D9R4_AMYMU|nr:ThiF family adenylyltransferase [Amycolatopsis mediterranei]ADJ46274.1 activating enzyme of the ubiquitin-like protein [Amycolatopsis mediterranei U32]AEK43067.1 activating enzyme of the ubiquitin-like protein [Amycolatopsis mediterranei S699]AFO77985.1 activating enzyme of the ubiquitin-like protein [Amycolatopsis mediterranei S699]AGT85113.1 activating enzyme of the ubiquitin-like protein [Amycolatopsis mediterranei RB]KDO05211.1 ubiquitin activation protein [Amycolatopsis mediterranei]